MKKKYYLILLSLVILSACSTDEKNKKDDDISMFPKAEAVYLDLVKEYTLNPDGTNEYHESKRLKLLTYRSFNSLFGETFIVYNPNFQELIINQSNTVQANGQTTQAPFNSQNEVLPRFASNFPDANVLKEMVITHTGLEKEAVINLDYTLKSKKGFFDGIFGEENIIQTCPVKRMTVRIRVPKDKTLNYELLNDSLKPQINTINDQTVYEWNFTNLPEESVEEHKADSNKIKLLFNTIFLKDQLLKFVAQESFTSEINDNIKKKVEETITGKSDLYGKISSLQEFVVQQISLKYVPLNYFDYQIRNTEKVWQSNIATPVEKAILLSGMLQNVGIQNEIHAVIPDYCTTQGNILDVQEYLIYIPDVEGNSLYISPIEINNSDKLYSIQSKNVIVLTKNGEVKNIENNKENSIIIEGTLNIVDKTKITGTVSAKFSNGFNPFLKLKAGKNYAEQLLSQTSSNTINASTPESTDITYKMDNKNAFKTQSNYLFTTLAFSDKGIESLHIGELPSKRTEPYELPGNIEESYKYTINIPKTIKSALQTVSIEQKFDFGSLIIKISQTENVINIERTINLKSKQIAVKDYADFRKMINTFRLQKYKELTFKNN